MMSEKGTAMNEIIHTIRHRLRTQDREQGPWNIQVIYEPEFESVELLGQGGRVSIGSQNIEKVVALLERAMELRDGIGGRPDDESEADG